MPKLSIITVNLNNKDGLISTAESIITQTWTDYEWIVIDGGSTDGSTEAIKEYAGKTDKLVYWCSEPDGGIYQGMNKGIEKASGEYCWFLNSGDYAYKNTTLAEIFANEFDEDIVYGDVEIKNNNWKRKTKKFDKKISLSFLIYKYLPHPAMLIKVVALKALGGYKENYKISSDWFFYTEAILKYKYKYKYVPIIFSMFDNKGLSSMKGSEIIMNQERKMALKYIFPYKYMFFYFISFFSVYSVLDKFNKTKNFVCKTKIYKKIRGNVDK